MRIISQVLHSEHATHPALVLDRSPQAYSWIKWQGDPVELPVPLSAIVGMLGFNHVRASRGKF